MPLPNGKQLEKSLALQANLKAVRAAQARGEASIDDLYKAADEFIEFLKEYKKATGARKLRIPNRSYLIRAL